MPQKEIKAGTQSVRVTDIDIIGRIPIKELRAVAGATILKARITFGALDGPRPQLTLQQVQKDLDAARQRLADEAAWREEMRGLLKQVE